MGDKIWWDSERYKHGKTKGKIKGNRLGSDIVPGEKGGK